MILVIAPPQDDHAVPVIAELRRRGHEVASFDLAELPARASATVTIEEDSGSAIVVRDAGSIDLDDIDTVWLRRLSAPAPPPSIEDAWYSASECHHFLVGIAQALSRCFWVNPLSALAMDGGWGKVRQLQAAREVGFEIPRTRMTNNPALAAAFVRSCEAGSVFKPFASREGRRSDGSTSAIYTSEITYELIGKLGGPRAFFGAVANAPCIFQEKIEKKLEVRATVMGSRVFACALDSQSDPASSVDYRHRFLKIPKTAHELPPEVVARLVKLHRALGLVFGTADLILTPDDRYVFLETNQQGQWLWTSEKTGLPLLQAFCDLLANRSRFDGEPSPLPMPRRGG